MTGNDVVISRIEVALSRIDAALERIASAPGDNSEGELAALRTLHRRVAARLDAVITRLDTAVERGE